MSHDVSRRAALRSIGISAAISTLAAGAAVASVSTAGANDDAELIRLGEEFDRLYAEWVPLAIKEAELSQKTHAGMKAMGIPSDLENLRNCYAATGLDRAEDACEAILSKMDPMAERMFALPVHTLAGLAALSRALRFVMVYPTNLDRPEEALNYDVQCFVKFQRALETLAAGGAL